MKKGQMNNILVYFILGIAFLGVVIVVMNSMGSMDFFSSVEETLCSSKVQALSRGLVQESGCTDSDCMEVYMKETDGFWDAVSDIIEQMGSDIGSAASALAHGDLMPDEWGPAQDTFVKTLLEKLLGFYAGCKTSSVTINPTDWSKCDPKFRNQYISSKSTAALNCAAQQVAELTKNCWDMNGRGKLYAATWGCYNVRISDFQGDIKTRFTENTENSEGGIFEQVTVGTEFQRGGDLIRSQVNTLFSCDNKDLVSKPSECKEQIEDTLISTAPLYAVWRGYGEINKENIFSRLVICSLTDKNYITLSGSELPLSNSITGQLDYNTIEEWYSDIVNSLSLSNGQYFDESDFNNLIKDYINEAKEIDLVVLDENTGEIEIDENTGEPILEKTTPCKKDEIIPYFNTALSAISDSDHNISVQEEVLRGEICSTRNDRRDCNTDPSTINSIKLTFEVQGLSKKITENHFLTILETTNVLGERYRYNSEFKIPTNREDTSRDIHFRYGESIQAGSTFQIIYCDGHLSLDSGMVAQGICPHAGYGHKGIGKYIQISNTLDSGGRRLKDEHIDATCYSTKTLLSIPYLRDNEVVQTMDDLCSKVTF